MWLCCQCEWCVCLCVCVCVSVVCVVCVCVCACVCTFVCSMERVKKFNVFTSLKYDRLRAQCPFVRTDGALFLPHRIKSIPGAQPNLL